MPLGLEHASYSLPERQAVKLTLFAPWGGIKGPNHRIFGGVDMNGHRIRQFFPPQQTLANNCFRE